MAFPRGKLLHAECALTPAIEPGNHRVNRTPCPGSRPVTGLRITSKPRQKVVQHIMFLVVILELNPLRLWTEMMLGLLRSEAFRQKSAHLNRIDPIGRGAAADAQAASNTNPYAADLSWSIDGTDGSQDELQDGEREPTMLQYVHQEAPKGPTNAPRRVQVATEPPQGSYQEAKSLRTKAKQCLLAFSTFRHRQTSDASRWPQESPLHVMSPPSTPFLPSVVQFSHFSTPLPAAPAFQHSPRSPRASQHVLNSANPAPRLTAA